MLCGYNLDVVWVYTICVSCGCRVGDVWVSFGFCVGVFV